MLEQRPALDWDSVDDKDFASVFPDGESTLAGGAGSSVNGYGGKALLNAPFDAQMCLEPVKYDWAYQAYLDAEANFWLPTEIPTADDIAHWNSGRLSEADRNATKFVLGYFATAENAISNNAVWVVHRHITNPECRMFITMQAAMESIHQHSYSYMIEFLGVDKAEAYDAFKTVEEVRDKIMWAADKTEEAGEHFFTTETERGKRKLLSNLVAFLMAEGVSFFGGFAMLLSFRLRNLMPGMASMIEYIQRDETQHTQFYANLVNGVLAENPGLRDQAFMEDCQRLAEEAVVAETAFVYAAMDHRGLMHVPRRNLVDHIRKLGRRRLKSINVPVPDSLDFGSDDPLPWLDEKVGLMKEGNFFETRITNYQRGTIR